VGGACGKKTAGGGWGRPLVKGRGNESVEREGKRSSFDPEKQRFTSTITIVVDRKLQLRRRAVIPGQGESLAAKQTADIDHSVI